MIDWISGVMNSDALISLIVPIFTLIKSSIEKKSLESKEIKENNLLNIAPINTTDPYYCHVLLIELLGLFLLMIISVMIAYTIALGLILCGVEAVEGIKIFLSNFWMVVFGFLSAKKFMMLPWVRKKTVGDKKAKILIVTPMIIIFTYFLVVNSEFQSPWLQWIVIILLVVLELKGLSYFSGELTVYPFSSVRIYLENGDVIECPNIENVKRKKKLVVIDEDGIQTRVRYDKIWRVEHIGGQKMVPKEKTEGKLWKYIKRIGK